MSTVDVLHPHNPAFERFLYASVGEDRKGQVVTVLSTLARLKLDPWEEAAALAALDRKAADLRLGLLLSRFRDVPALGHDHGSVARDLTFLLPQRPTLASRPVGPSGPSGEERKAVSMGTIWTIAAVLLLVVQMMSILAAGSGE